MDDCFGVGKGAGDGFFDQNVLTPAGGQRDMLQMQMMRCANVQGVHPGIGGSGGVRAESVESIETARIFPSPGQVAAGEVEVNLATYTGDRLCKNLCKGTTTQDAQTKTQWGTTVDRFQQIRD